MAKAAGIPIDSYKKYEGDKSVPGGEALSGMGGAGIDLTALLVPDGPKAAQARAGNTTEPATGYANIPLYDVRARAGPNGLQTDGEKQVNELAFREDWIRRELRVSPKDLRLIHVEGDSMEPDLRSGDIILVDHTDTAARREGVYVIRMDNALLVKALQRLPGGVIKVMSRNPAYAPFNVNVIDVESSEDFSIIGRVVWACRRF